MKQYNNTAPSMRQHTKTEYLHSRKCTHVGLIRAEWGRRYAVNLINCHQRTKVQAGCLEESTWPDFCANSAGANERTAGKERTSAGGGLSAGKSGKDTELGKRAGPRGGGGSRSALSTRGRSSGSRSAWATCWFHRSTPSAHSAQRFTVGVSEHFCEEQTSGWRLCSNEDVFAKMGSGAPKPVWLSG